MTYYSNWQSYPVPEDGEDEPPDGFNGALSTIGEQENWGDIIQTFIRQIEHDTVKTGPIADRPASPDIEDGRQAFYCSTDEGTNSDEARLYIYDAVNDWRPITPPPDSTSGGGWTPSNWGIIDVSNHGFPGDETGGDLFSFIANNGPGRFILPPGRYSVESELDFNSNLAWSTFEIIGQGDVTLVVNNNQAVDTLIRTADTSSPLDYVRLENFDVEIDYGTQAGRDDPTTFQGADAGVARLSVNKRLVMKDIELVGRRAYHSLRSWYEADTANRTDYSGEIYNQRVNMLNPDATAVIENVRYPDGGEGVNNPRVIPVSVEQPNVGLQVYKNCHVGKWSGNGYYIKDGTGTSILWSCTAGNIGGQAFRYGQQDMSIGGQTWTDAGLDNLDHTAGTHLEIHLGEGTACMGHRVRDTRGASELVRARGGNKQCTVRDVYIETTGTNFAIRTSSDGSSDNSVTEHGEGYLVFDNVRIEVDSPDTSATQLGAIANRRKNTVFQNVTTLINAPDTDFAALYVEEGDATFRNCRFISTDTNSAPYSAIIGPNDSTVTTVGKVHFDNCEFSDSIRLYSGDQIPYLGFVGCDLRSPSTLFDSADPQTMYETGDITDFVFHRNLGYLTSTDYGATAQNTFAVQNLTVSGDNVTRADADRKIFISSTEPTGWTDGDLWGEPQ